MWVGGGGWWMTFAFLCRRTSSLLFCGFVGCRLCRVREISLLDVKYDLQLGLAVSASFASTPRVLENRALSLCA